MFLIHNPFRQYWLWFMGSLCGGIALTSWAGVVTDGSLGNVGIQTLTGPQYLIAEHLGQRFGTNVFHSFSQFNVLTGESLTFTVAKGTENILARVTGHEPSTINGLVSTGGSLANLWLINPQGWLIGSQAQFDVNGAFHLSTADSIGLADGGTFRANLQQASQLSVGAPLTLELDQPTQAAITIDQADLQFKPYQTVSFTAPNVTLNQSAVTVPGGQLLFGGLSRGVWQLDAQGLKSTSAAFGNITINGRLVDETGRVLPISTSQALTTISTNSNKLTNLKSDPIYGGLVQLLSGSLNLHHAAITQSSLGDKPGGDITVQAQVAVMDRKADLSVDSNENGPSGNIDWRGEKLSMSENATMTSANQSHKAGGVGGGHIRLQLNQALSLDSNAQISSSSIGLAPSGTIKIQTDQLALHATSAISTNSADQGEAGTVTIDAKIVQLDRGGTIDSSALVSNAGTVTIKAQEVSLQDRETFIASTAAGKGHGGVIDIEADRLHVLNQAQIRTTAKGAGAAGDIHLQINDLLWLDSLGKITSAAKKSNAGKIELEQLDTAFIRHAQITTSVEGPLGNGGDIAISAHNVVLDGGFIQANTAALGASGGNIRVDQNKLNYLLAGGNNVMIGGLERQTFDGNARDNVIQAAAPSGNPGKIDLPYVELNIAGQLLSLDSRFVLPQIINDNPCRVSRTQQLSSLVALGSGGLPATAADAVDTRLQRFLTPEAIDSLAPKANSAAVTCPEQAL